MKNKQLLEDFKKQFGNTLIIKEVNCKDVKIIKNKQNQGGNTNVKNN